MNRSRNWFFSVLVCVSCTGGTSPEEGNTFSLYSIGGPPSAPGELVRVTGLFGDPRGGVLVWDETRSDFQSFGPNGDWRSSWGKLGLGPGEFRLPTGAAVAPGGDVYVADWVENHIQRLDSEGRPKLAWGGTGSGSGEFRQPTGVALDHSGRVMVAEWGNHQIQVFSESGSYLDRWGGLTGDPQDFSQPIEIEVSADKVYVLDLAPEDGLATYIHTLELTGSRLSRWYSEDIVDLAVGMKSQLFAAQGQSVLRIDDRGSIVSTLSLPNPVRSLDSDGLGNLFVLHGNSNIWTYDSTGAYVASLGKPLSVDSRDFIWYPFDLAVGPEGQVVVASSGQVDLYSRHGFVRSIGGAYNLSSAKVFLLGNPSTFDDDQSIYYGYDDEIRKFDQEGQFLDSWELGRSELGPRFVRDVFFDSERQELVVLDHRNTVLFYSTAGELRATTTLTDVDASAYAFAPSSKGELLVLDTDPDNPRSPRVVRYARSGAQIASFPLVTGSGETPIAAWDIAASRDMIYIADRYANQILVLDGDGMPLGEWGVFGNGPEELNRPISISIGPEENIFVLEYGNHRVQVFSAWKSN